MTSLTKKLTHKKGIDHKGWSNHALIKERSHHNTYISHTTQLIGAMVRVALIAITQLTTIKIREKEKVVA